MESKTSCPCGLQSKNCFVEQTEVEDKPFESYICFECGMTSNSYLSFDSDKLEEYTENHSALMNDLRIMDEERGIVWFPSVINMGEKGIIYPDGKINDWHWHYAKVVDVPVISSAVGLKSKQSDSSNSPVGSGSSGSTLVAV